MTICRPQGGVAPKRHVQLNLLLQFLWPPRRCPPTSSYCSLAFVPIITGLREYAETLEAGAVPKPHSLKRRGGDGGAGGQWVADVFPLGLESLLFGGFRGEVWIEPGEEPTQGALYRAGGASGAAAQGGVGVVLGAGNQTPVVALDILHVLVAQNMVVACKMNPVNEYAGPFLRRALAPLAAAGFLEFLYGGAAVGAALCAHPAAAAVHLTGSAATHDAIVWQGRPKEAEPPLATPCSAELGCVTPYIIVPGPWSDADLEYHADSVATGLTHNAGHNCLKAEVVVTDAEWPLRGKFLEALRRRLAAAPNRVSFYPGSGHRAAAFLKRFPDAEQIGGGTVEGADGALLAKPPPAADGQEGAGGPVDARQLPWLLKTGLAPEEAATRDENWCGVLQEVELRGCGGGAAAFLPAATRFANERCWGTLSCALFVHPATRAAHPGEVDAALGALRYGTICVNVPGNVGFALTKLGWGAYGRGGSPQDIGSGNCKVHNTLLFDHVQKSVVHGPWCFHPFPFWLTSNRNAEEVARLALQFLAAPSLGRATPLAAAALRG